MAESKFIKAVAFGGYDTSDVDKRLEALYDLVYNLKNELRETKLIIKKYEDGAETDKAYENALAVERAQITQLQVKNEQLSEKNKVLKEEAKLKEQENAELQQQVSELSKKLDETSAQLNVLSGKNSTESLGIIFVEAQKSREMIINAAQQEADSIKKSAEEFSEKFISDINARASRIIYDAEKKAADITADAKNNSEQMRTAEVNLRAVMLDNIQSMTEEIHKLQSFIDTFEKESTSLVEKSEKLLDAAGNELKSGGIPVFEIPKNYAPEYPQKPVQQADSENKQPAENAPAKNDALDKLQAMAEAIEKKDDEKSTKKTETKDNKPKENAKGGMDLNSLLKQAYSLTD